MATGDEPDTLITAVFAASGVEFIVSALMKLWEIAAEVKKEKDSEESVNEEPQPGGRGE